MRLEAQILFWPASDFFFLSGRHTLSVVTAAAVAANAAAVDAAGPG